MRRTAENARFTLLATAGPYRILRYTLAPEPFHPAVDGPIAATAPPSSREGFVKQVQDEAFVDLIACERDCRSCSYAAALDCDGNCGVCPHNGYCPCVNPVVARSKSALRLIELRPILLQDLRVRT